MTQGQFIHWTLEAGVQGHGKVQNGLYKLDLTRFSEESGNHTPTKLDIKLKRVQEMNRKIDELKDQYYDIKDISESELQVIEADIQSMEDRLEELEVRIKDILNSLIAKSSVSSVHNHENAISQTNSKLKLEIKLPEIPLPVFRASLQGDAKLLEAVDDSFESLITALKTRFENKRLLTETHINAILEIEKLTSESARDIRTMTDILSKNIRALKLLGFERNNLSDLILLNIILKKIDRETCKQFEQSINSNQIPELDTFIMFLEKRSQTIDSINRSAPITHKPKQVPFHKGSFDKFEEKSYCGLAINAEINSDNLNQQLQAFWEIEKVDESSIEHSLEEEICETQYQNTHYRTEEGRYVVQLPLKKIHTL
ncbi:integrase_H2C2 domain-containing protein [Trichonephila clavipes]|nr:integrase_H2C2 domain-containing protein [Trichonephila clavipes]